MNSPREDYRTGRTEAPNRSPDFISSRHGETETFLALLCQTWWGVEMPGLFWRGLLAAIIKIGPGFSHMSISRGMGAVECRTIPRRRSKHCRQGVSFLGDCWRIGAIRSPLPCSCL